MGLDSGKEFPIEPLYSLAEAKLLLPVRGDMKRLYNILYRYRDELDPPLYQRQENGSKMRYLSSSDLRLLRNKLFTQGYFTGNYRNYRKDRNKKS